MQQPPGYEDGTARCFKLIKSLYGLKQAPLVWYDHISSLLTTARYKKTTSNLALFIIQGEDGPTWVLLYVDDILVFAERLEGIQRVEDALQPRLELTNGSIPTSYLGINIEYSREQGECELSSSSAIASLDKKYNLQPLQNNSRVPRVPMTTDPT
jgi:hypothetical protein